MSRLRLSSFAAVIALAVLAAPAGAGTSDSSARAIATRAGLSRAILTELNAVRVRRGLRPVKASRGLTAAARRHSLNMAKGGFFTHESANGAAFWRRVKASYSSSGYRSWQVGENLLWASPDIGAKEAVQRWLRSPKHREIMLSTDWREIGLGAVHAPSSPGAYRGLDVTIVTADFGARTR